MNTFTSIDRNKPSQTDTKDPKHGKYAQTTDRNLINLGEDTRTPTINTPRQQYERQPTHTIGSPHPNRKIYSVGILESRSTKNYFIINMYEDTSPYLEKTRKNDQATTRMRTRIKYHISNRRLLRPSYCATLYHWSLVNYPEIYIKSQIFQLFGYICKN